MPFNRPTLTALRAAAAADLATAVPGADALLRFSNLGVLAAILAAMTNGEYGYLDWIARQSVPFTATGENLEGWAALTDVLRKPATAAGAGVPIQVTFTGTNGTVLPTSTPLQRSDGTAYVTTSSGTVASLSVTVNAEAVDAGSDGTAVIGQTVNLGTAIAGINSGGVVAAAGSPGTDVETDADLRTRMLQSYQAPPQGGDASDYVTWALEVAGVTRAWTVPLEGGPGTVSVYFMMDAVEAAFSGFPQGTNGVATNETRSGAPAAATGDQLAVANWIFPLRPVTALVSAKAPSANAVAFTINGISDPGLQADIGTAIDEVFLAYAAPGGAVNANGAPFPPVDLSFIESAIAAIAGTAGFVITAVTCAHGTVAPGPQGNIASNAGFLCVRGVITWT